MFPISKVLLGIPQPQGSLTLTHHVLIIKTFSLKLSYLFRNCYHISIKCFWSVCFFLLNIQLLDVNNGSFVNLYH